jgi:hypothetical protein
MNKLRIFQTLFPMLLLLCCKHEDPAPKVFDLDYMAHIHPDNFVSVINNPYLPIKTGSKYTYTAQSAEGVERIEVEVLAETRMIMGITCMVVRDRAYLNNEIIEDTYDWFAQDKDGNVWYFGEDVDNYSNGEINNHYGSWEAGTDGAEPGIIMLGNPVTGLQYRQEHYPGAAEDQGEIIARNESVSVSAGSFKDCLKIRETNPLDPDFLEYKYYAKGVGLVLVEKADAPDEKEELQSYDVK